MGVAVMGWWTLVEEPEELGRAVMSLRPGLQPRLERRAHADDQLGSTQITSVPGAELVPVCFAVGWDKIDQFNSLASKDLYPIGDDRETRDHQRLGRFVGGVRRDGEAKDAKDGEEAKHAKNDGSGSSLRRKIFAINYCSLGVSFCVCHPLRPKTHLPSPCPKYVLFLPA